jgi:hypothetical protein
MENKENQVTRPGRDKKKYSFQGSARVLFSFSLGLRGERSLHFPSPGVRDFGLCEESH